MDLIKTHTFELALNIKGDEDSQKLALVLPGRLDTKDYACFNSHLEYLANRGFLAVSFDSPGTWESPGGIGLFTTTNYIKADNELIEYFGNKPTLLIGHSRGGAVANIVGTNNPVVVALITVNASFGTPSPPSPEEMKLKMYVDYRDLPPGDKKTSIKKRFEVPLTYFEDGEQYDDAEILKICRKPKLIFYSTNDEFHPPGEVKAIFDSLPEPKVLHELKCSHDYRYYPEIVNEVNKEIELFLDKYFFLIRLKTNH